VEEMVFSRYGSELRLIKWIDWKTVQAERIEDGKILPYYVADLRADGGIAEIENLLGEPPEVL
jgi:hypothetical protein